MANESKTATLVFICDYAHLKQGDKGTYSKSLAAEIVNAGVAVYEAENGSPANQTKISNSPEKEDKKVKKK